MNQRAFGMVVAFLGVALILCIAGFVALPIVGAGIPDVLTNVAVGVLAGLVGLLAKTPDPNDAPQPVRHRVFPARTSDAAEDV